MEQKNNEEEVDQDRHDDHDKGSSDGYIGVEVETKEEDEAQEGGYDGLDIIKEEDGIGEFGDEEDVLGGEDGFIVGSAIVCSGQFFLIISFFQ